MKAGYKMTKLGEIPVEWEVVKLGEVAKTYAGGTPKRGIADYYNGDIPWIKSGEVDNNNIFNSEEKVTELAIKETATRLIEPNSILVALYGATAGKIGILKIKACSNQAVLAVNSIKINLLNEFLYHYLKKCTTELLNLSQGSGQPNLSKSIIDSVNIPLPPLPEQRTIATILSTVDEKLELIEAQIRETQALKQGLMQRLLSRGIGHTEFKDSELGEIPLGWEVRKLGEVAEISAGSTPLRSKANEYFKGGEIPWVKTLDLNNSDIQETDEKITPLAVKESSCKILSQNTVLVAMYGGFNQIGRTGILKINATTNQAISALVVDENEIAPRFLLAWLNFRVDHWKKFAASSRKDPNITQKDVKNFLIVVPPLEQQQIIFKTSDWIDEKLTILQTKKSETKALKKGLMQQLLTGKIRVKTTK